MEPDGTDDLPLGLFDFDVGAFSGSVRKTAQSLMGNVGSYWKMKGIIQDVKMDPSKIIELDYFNVLVQYLDMNSRLAEQPFWRVLTPQLKANLAKCIRLMDEQPLDIVVNADPSTAEILIVFSGYATVKSVDEGPASDITLGRVFGAIELFNNKDRRKNLDSTVVPLSVYTDRGSMFRLSYKDYNEQCVIPFLPAKIEPIKKWSEEDDDDPQEGEVLTDEDFEIIRIRKLSRKRLDKDLFHFLLKNRMSARVYKDPGREYICRGTTGKLLQLSHSNPPTVYIIIDGSIKLQIGRKKELKKAISLGKKGEPRSMSIKTSLLPVMLMEPGAVLTAIKGLYHVGQEFDAKGGAMSSKPSGYGLLLGFGHDDSDPPSTFDGIPSKALVGASTKKNKKGLSLSLQAAEKLSQLKRDKLREENEKCHYELSMYFQQNTIYLSIPFKVFKAALNDSSFDTKKVLYGNLAKVNGLLERRMEQLLFWIKGGSSLQLVPPIRTEEKADDTAFTAALASGQLEDSDDRLLRGTFCNEEILYLERSSGLAVAGLEGSDSDFTSSSLYASSEMENSLPAAAVAHHIAMPCTAPDILLNTSLSSMQKDYDNSLNDS